MTVQWVSVTDELPPLDRLVPLWGSKLIGSPDGGDDYPLPGRLCACHEQWVIESWELQDEREPEDCEVDDDGKDVACAEYTQRMLGEVTHWLKWWPTP